jgi:hypothetical protein
MLEMTSAGSRKKNLTSGRRKAPAVLHFILLFLSVLTLFCHHQSYGGMLSRPEAVAPTVKSSGCVLTRISVGLDRKTRQGWVPVCVELEAGRAFVGDLVVTARNNMGRLISQVRRPLELVSGHRKRYRLYLRNEQTGGFGFTVSAELDDGIVGGKTLSASVVNVVAEDYYLCVVGSKRKRLLLGVEKVPKIVIDPSENLEEEVLRERTIAVARPEVWALPDRVEGYNALEVLVLHDLPTTPGRISPLQLQAIEDFVRNGGVVALSVSDQSWFESSFAKQLLGAIRCQRLSGNQATAMLSSLERKYGQGLTVGGRGLPGCFSFSGPDLRPMPIKGVFFRRLGSGMVLLIGFDMSARRFLQWPGQRRYWLDICDRLAFGKPKLDSAIGSWSPEVDQLKGSNQRVRLLNISKERGVPFLLVFFMILTYLVLVGPVNFFVLRRIKMQILSLVTIPCLAFLFVGLTLLVGYLSRGMLTVGRSVTVAVVGSGQNRAGVLTLQSVFPANSMREDISGSQQDLVARLDLQESMVRQTPTFGVSDDTGFRLENSSFRMWQMAYFQKVGHHDLGGTFSLVASRELRIWQYALQNNTQLLLEDAFVISADRKEFCWIGNVKPGESRSGMLQDWVKINRRAPIPAAILQSWVSRPQSIAGGNIKNVDQSFAIQAGAVVASDPRVFPLTNPFTIKGPSRMLLFARIGRDSEFGLLKIGGSPVRPAGAGRINVLVLKAERKGS